MAYAYENNPTNPDAKPLYNSSILKFWNWFNDVWSCSDWMTWHKSNMAKYGIDTANQKFMEHWNNLALASSALDCRTFNTSFRDYTKKVGLYDQISNIVSDIAGSAGDTISNIGKGASSASKTLKIALPLIMIIIIIVGVIYITKYSKKLGK